MAEADRLVRRGLVRWAIRWTLGAAALTALVVYDARAWWCVAASAPFAALGLLAPLLMRRRLLETARALAREE